MRDQCSMRNESKETTTSAASGVNSLQREEARAMALEAGFTEAGVVPLPHAAEERDAQRFADWVQAGRAGTMQYLERKREDGRLTRERVGIPFPWARSALICFASYGSAQPLSTDAAPEGAAWIARYAWSSRINERGERVPSDYHKVLLKRLHAVETGLHERFGEFASRAYVDTGPVVERALAVAAGVGWIGKNTCVIHPVHGSFGFLAVLVTSLEVSKAAREQGSESASRQVSAATEFALVPDRCGSCTRCIEACPTDALIAPYQMDARRCISYLTIEHKGPIDETLMPGMGRQVFGCDICQDVCPWNGKARREIVWRDPTHSAKDAEWMGHSAADHELEPRQELVNPALEWLASLDEPAFERMFNGSPVRRAGFDGLRRNVAIAMGNSGLAQFVRRLEEWAEAADEGLRSAARWALRRVRGDGFAQAKAENTKSV